ncbi:hypothetical protein D9619_006703 [Psilocybe cf. subviscida]|uniref:G domain-containing protein n=1 Tax=Psilocybe cf. subviscida TaxID=2480587 RepID=A0A8H5B4A4_9AGAR|nr:hypothetical protein D9619_006703 [Psilocybe cf. subviscida]
MARGKTKPEWENYIIAIVGPPAAGKSFFINRLVGEEVARVGDSYMNSVTEDLQPVEIAAGVVQQNLTHWNPANPGRKLIILDTPGLDGASVNDSGSLKRVTDWLAKSYGADAKLAGIIYLYGIDQIKVTGVPKLNPDVLAKLCGEDACKSIVLGTTQWTRVPANNRQISVTREQELKDGFWKDMIGKGSHVYRVDDQEDTNNSPWKLVETVLFKGGSPTLHIERELTEMHESLLQTDSGTASGLRVRIGNLQKSLKSARASKSESKEKIGDFLREAKSISAQVDSLVPRMILVLGMTGAGKSTFIQSTGPKGPQPTINHGLASSPAPVKEFKVEDKNGRTISLVDTPGFNNTEISDSKILENIIAFLKSRQVSKDQKVLGIIYLLDTSIWSYPPVSPNRIEGSLSAVIATVHRSANLQPLTDDEKGRLQKKYGTAYHGDHFGWDPSEHSKTAWKIISRVLASGNAGVSAQAVINGLEDVLHNPVQPVQPFLQRILSYILAVLPS